MKKFLVAFCLLSSALTPALSFAMDRCGFICRHEVAPYLIGCKTDWQDCSKDPMMSIESNQLECKQKYDKCMDDVKEYQLSCVDLCVRGEVL